ncbi:Uncharacterised protein [uncultured archaeon]|nr:Uncharacterised protein [uncultured archaeon]
MGVLQECHRELAIRMQVRGVLQECHREVYVCMQVKKFRFSEYIAKQENKKLEMQNFLREGHMGMACLQCRTGVEFD